MGEEDACRSSSPLSVWGGGGRGRGGGKGCLALEEELKSLESAGRQPVFGGDRGGGEDAWRHPALGGG